MGVLKDKRICGIAAGSLTAAVFCSISLIVVLNFLKGTPWYIFSSALRLVFGLVVLYLLKKLYDKDAKEVFRFNDPQAAFAASAGFLLFFVYTAASFCIGAKAVTGFTAGLLISRVILQQLTTGFYEEILFRALMCEGYRYTKGGTAIKLGFALFSSVIFGAVHILTGWDITRFIETGMIGFAFAVVYLQTDNIILPMILHFVYDVIINFGNYIEWRETEIFSVMLSWRTAAYAVMFVVSLIILIRKEKTENTPYGGKHENTYSQARRA